MALIYTNATLTQVTATGTTPDYDVPGVDGSARWTGSVGITVRRDPIVEVQGGNQLDVVRKTRLEIPYDVGQLIVHGDTVTYTFEGTTVIRAVDDVTRTALVGRVRVELEPT